MEAIKTALDVLQKASMKLGEAIYKDQADAPEAGEEAPSSAAEEDVVDADFEEVDDDKK